MAAWHRAAPNDHIRKWKQDAWHAGYVTNNAIPRLKSWVADLAMSIIFGSLDLDMHYLDTELWTVTPWTEETHKVRRGQACLSAMYRLTTQMRGLSTTTNMAVQASKAGLQTRPSNRHRLQPRNQNNHCSIRLSSRAHGQPQRQTLLPVLAWTSCSHFQLLSWYVPPYVKNCYTFPSFFATNLTEQDTLSGPNSCQRSAWFNLPSSTCCSPPRLLWKPLLSKVFLSTRSQSTRSTTRKPSKKLALPLRLRMS